MAEKKSPARTIVIVLIAIVAIVCGAAIALVGGSAYYIARHVHSDYVGAEDAAAQFAAARTKLAGRRALLELAGGGDPIVHRPPADARPPKITAVRAIVYDPNDRKLMNLTLPVWLLRMGSGDRLQFIDDRHGFDSSRLHLTFADVERHGPGLIVDGSLEHGVTVLVWTE